MGATFSSSYQPPFTGIAQDETGIPITLQLSTTANAAPASSGNNAFIAATTGKKVRVLWYQLQSTGTVNVKFVDTAGSPADLSQLWNFAAREGISVGAPPGTFLFESGTGLGVQVNLSAAVGVNVRAGYLSV